jgi:chromosome segregation ATPase
MMAFRDKILEFIPEDKRDAAKATLDAMDKTLDGYATDIDDLKRKLRSTKEIDPEEVRSLEKQVDELTAAKKELAQKLTTAEKTAKEATEKLDTESAAVRNLVIDQGLTEQLVKLKVHPAQLPAVKALLAQRLTVESDGSTRKAIAKFLDGSGKEMTAPLAEYRLRTTAEEEWDISPVPVVPS